MTTARWLGALLAILVTGCSQTAPPAKAPEAKKEPPSYFKVDPATAGVLRGKADFRGKKPPRKALRIDEDLQCTQMNKGGLFDESVVVNANGTLGNVFVYVKSGLEGKKFPPAEAPLVIDQKRCRFEPHVAGVRVGQTIRVTNSDPLTHNIHPQPKNNREWNQSQGEGAPPLERRFVWPEVMIRVKCNVHSWMRAYIGAVEHPYFAVTGADGTFEIPQLPPGDYTLEAWHEKLGTQEQRISLAASGAQNVNFTFQEESRP